MTRMTGKTVLLVVAMVVGVVLSAGAATEYTWDVGDNGNWSLGSNWTPTGGPPNSNAHKVWIDNSAYNVTVYLNMDAAVSGLKVDVGDTLSVNSTKNLTIVKDDAGNNPTFINSGQINTAAYCNININNAILDIYNKGTIYAYGTSINGNNSTLNFNETGFLILNGSMLYGTVVNEPNHTIRGGGWGGITANTLINKGNIIADDRGLWSGAMYMRGEIINESILSVMGASSQMRVGVNSTVSGGRINPNDGTFYVDNGKIFETIVGNGNVIIEGAILIGNTIESTNMKVNYQYPSYFKKSNTLNTGGYISIDDGATLKMAKDSIYQPSIINNGTIKLNSSGSATYLIADDAVATLTGTGSVVLGGNEKNYLTANLSGSFINDTGHTIRGGGIIEGAVENRGNIIADNGALKLNGPVTGEGSISIADNATLRINRNLQAGNFTMSNLATLDVANNRYIDLKGNWSFAQTDESKWIWGTSTALKFSGAGASQSLEVGGEDKGAVIAGFSNNFDLVTLSLSGAGTWVQLTDAADNGNRHSPEALYADILEMLAGTTLDLYGKHLYTLLGGTPHLVLVGEGGLFGGGAIIDTMAPVPLPGSLLLLGGGLLGLVVLGRRRGGRK